MITCQHARQLFDRYLDGELSPSLQAELHAHQLSCSTCQGELAILEACGDVVALDRCEPRPSESFTDRVLLARRVQLSRKPRRWGRAALIAGSPMAAAASILLAISLIMPSTPELTPRVLGPGDGGLEAMPEGSRGTMVDDRTLSAEEKRELEAAPQMPAGFMDTVLALGVDRTKDTVESAQGSLRELGLLWHQAFSDAGDQLAAQLGQNRGDGSSGTAPEEHPAVEPDHWAPRSLHPDPSSDSTSHSRLLDPI